MLRKLLTCLFSVSILFLASCKDEKSLQYLSENEVYFFYQETCPHCHTAAQYIKEKYPDLRVKGLDIKMPGNMRLFQQAVKDYKISTAAGTPLIALGDNYIMGWSDEGVKNFDKYVASYK